MEEENPYSFESFVKHRPGVSEPTLRVIKLITVFKTLEKELVQGGMEGLTPIDRMDLAAGMAVRHHRRASVQLLICSCRMR